jgi:hypothetical protein
MCELTQQGVSSRAYVPGPCSPRERVFRQHWIASTYLRPAFSDDSRWVAYHLDLPCDEARELREADSPVPRRVQLLNFADGR